jgi:hypothetical protein
MLAMATIRMRRRPGPLAALLAAGVVSTTGSQMTLLALPWFVLVTTGSPARMGVVVAADLLPMVGLVPLLHAVGALSFPVLVGLVALHWNR